MSQVSYLDNVIRLVDAPDFSTTYNTTHAEKLVLIEECSGRAVAKKPLFKRVNRYIVKNINDNRHQAQCTTEPITVQDFASDRRIGLAVTYRVYCEPGREEQVAEALNKVNPPRAALEQSIGRWVMEFVRGREGEFIDEYPRQKEKLRIALKTLALEETGLTLDARLALQHEEKLETFSIQKRHIPVRCNDINQEFNLVVSADMEVIPDHLPQAVLAYKNLDGLENRFIAKIREYCATHVTLHEYYLGLNHRAGTNQSTHRDFPHHLSDEERHAPNGYSQPDNRTDTVGQPAHLENLHRLLNEELHKEGRKLTFLNLDSDSSRLKAESFLEEKIPIHCELQEYPEPVSIDNRVQLSLADIGQYLRRGAPVLKPWLETTLQRIIRSAIFKTKYLDLLLRFGTLEVEIKHQMQSAAAEIGYTLQHLVTVPDLEPLKWKDSFTIETEEETYSTKVAQVNVRLKTIVTCRIPDLTKVESYLNRRVNLPELLKQAVHEEIANLLHKVEPERFYMRFEYSNIDGEKAVEQELRETIRGQLLEKYHTQVISVVPKPLETDLLKRLQSLVQCPGKFHIEITSLHIAETVFLYGLFQVEAVDKNGWYTFQQRQFELADIAEFIQIQIAEKLSTLNKEQLTFAAPEHHRHLKREVDELIRNEIVLQFGVVVRIIIFSRDKTNTEKQLSNIENAKNAYKIKRLERSIEVEDYRNATLADRRKKADKNKLDELNIRSNDRSRLIEGGADDEELRDTNEHIEALSDIPIPSDEEWEADFDSLTAKDEPINLEKISKSLTGGFQPATGHRLEAAKADSPPPSLHSPDQNPVKHERENDNTPRNVTLDHEDV